MLSSIKKPALLSDVSNAMNAILSFSDPYIILQVNLNATEAQIIEAYKKLILKYHPDKHSDETIKKLATEVAQKLNRARDVAIDRLKNRESKPEDKLNSIDRLKLFSNRVMSQGLGGFFAGDKTFFNVLHDTKEHAFGIAMLWARSVITLQQEITLKRIQTALANTTTVMELLNLAQGIQPYLKNNNAINRIRTRRHLDVLQDSPMAELNLLSDENIGWNLDTSQCLLLVQEIATTYANRPVIMHDLALKSNNHTFIGLYYKDERYYVFNPNHILFDSYQQELQALSWEEASQQIITALYHPEHTIAQSAETMTAAISLFTLRPQPLAINDSNKHAILEQSPIGWSRLTQWFNEGKFKAEDVLQSIYDGELTGVLPLFYKARPELFSTAILTDYLMKALENEQITFAWEICQLDKLSPQNTWKLSREYINQYIKQGCSLKLLIDSLPLFKEAGIDLMSLIEPEVKKKGSPWLDDIDKKIIDIETLRQILQLDIRLTEKQRITLIAYLSNKIYLLADRMSTKNLQKSMASNIKEQNESIKSIDEIKKKITEKIVWLQILIDFGYHFIMPDGLKESSYLYLALVDAELSDLAYLYWDTNLINIDAKNKNDETVLNHLTAKKKWTEIRYLINKGASYSIGPQIKAEAIPPFAAWVEDIELLRDLYEEFNRKQLLTMVFKEGDLLSAAAFYGAIPIIEYALAHGFDKRLCNHPTLYLYSVKNIESAQCLLKSLSKSYLNHQIEPITTKPYTLYSIANITDITPPPPCQEKLWPSLLGVAKNNMDAEVTKLGIAKLVKLVLNENTVYYSSDDELTKRLCLYFEPHFIEQCYQAIQLIIFQSANPRVPDLAYCINQLSRLLDLLQERRKVRMDLEWEVDYLEYRMAHSQFDAKLYQNQLELLQQGGPLLGLKVTYDVNDIAIGYTWINDIQLLGMETFIDAKSPDFADNRDNQFMRLWFCISSLYMLKAIFEETLGCVFNKIELINDEFMSAIFLQSYDNFRKALSSQKAFIPLDTNRFFSSPPVGNTNESPDNPTLYTKQ